MTSLPRELHCTCGYCTSSSRFSPLQKLEQKNSEAEEMDRVPAANGLSFRVGFTGHSGHLTVEPLPPVERPHRLHELPDFILPPAFPEETPETIKEYVKEKYLLPRLDEDIFSPQNAGRQWEFDWFDRAEIQPEPSVPRSVIVPSWEIPFRRKSNESDSQRWEPQSVEVDMSELVTGAQDSGALPRIVGPAKDFVRGSINNRPFRPGGLENAYSLGKIYPDGACNGEWARELLHGESTQILPPGFKDGLDLGDLKAHPLRWDISENVSVEKSTPHASLNELSVQFDDLFKKAWEDDANISDEDGNVPEVENKMELANESVQTETEEDLVTVDNAFKKEPSILDDILTDESAESTLRAEEDINKQRKEGWAITGSTEEIVERFDELVPDMALNFPFELDPFQKEAIFYLERGKSVFVAAHTSAGKTVVAEYAFALASKHCTRAVYTAPIKTISNQKYRDFCGKFDVGLLTGDVSLRPEASCLIMTTEILRSMLYRGADIIRDIEWVIFDEVHYVNDVERGVVWEEVIIMLPRHINFVLLSATVPNTIEFADWIGRTKAKEIQVTGTMKRPVPLEHCLFYSGELYKICENEQIIPLGLKAAKDVHKKKNSTTVSGAGSHSGSSIANERAKRHESSYAKQNKHSASRNAANFSGANRGTQSSTSNNWGSWRSEASIWLSLINNLSKKSLLPVVIFCFSKNRCDKSADNLTGTDLTTSSEKSVIRIFCDKAFSRLKGSDRNLPQVVRVQSLLQRGIGVHHAGLLPIVKEVVEMLFCRGVVKILFSTETFAMGVNAPARTVVFDSLRKFDGKEFRQLLPGEYTQMAGRAGRRGLDKIGTVVVLCRDEIPEENDLKHVIVGSATRLESQFRLTYIMILHLLRVEELKVEDMLKRSFAEFHAQKKLPEQQQLLMLKLAQPAKTIECIKGEPAIEDYYDMYTEAEKYSSKIIEAVMLSPVSQQFLTPGRVVIVKSQLLQAQDHLLGAIVKSPSANYKKYLVLVLTPELPAILASQSDSIDKKGGGFQVLVPKSKRGLEDEYCSTVTSRKGSGTVNIKLPYRGSAAGVNYEVREVANNEFLSICNRKIKIDQVRLLEDGSAGAFSFTVQQLSALKTAGNKYPPALDPVKDLKLKNLNDVENYSRWTGLLQKMGESKCHGCVKLEENIKLARELKRHSEEVNALQFQMSDEALQQMPDFQGRIDVLKEIGCIDADLVVQLKGRVACEMNSGEELICTECLFENQLNDLEPEEAVAIMSAFVFQQKKTSEPSLTPRLAHAKKRLYDTAIRLGQLQAEFKLQVDPEEYASENLKFGLVEVVYEWAKGTPFADICELTDVPEGMIVRTIVRLDETCREFRNAAAIMGNSALHKKMETASNTIKRDIVFAASLYITGV